MKYLAFIALSILLVLGCESSEKKSQPKAKKELIMYQASEMANLMNDMYTYNQEVKQNIIDGKPLGEFPEEFLSIHTAIMTKANGRNENFENFSKLFINVERELYNAESTVPVKDRFNNAVGVCISCHQTECTGPIPRIKKLLIK